MEEKNNSKMSKNLGEDNKKLTKQQQIDFATKILIRDVNKLENEFFRTKD
jgi:AmiR/NasT family two-component response regulator